MDDLTEVYNELIMEHSMNSYNKKKLENADYCEIGHNPNCGDEITLELKVNGDVIEDMAFSGHGCAISQASTSIMIDTLKGKTIKEAKEIIKIFIEMIKRETTSEEELKKLEDAIAFRNVSNMPARVKCALLAWHTVEDMLNKNQKTARAFTRAIIILRFNFKIKLSLRLVLVVSPEIHRFIVLQLCKEALLLKLLLYGIKHLFTLRTYCVIVITGGYIFKKAGLSCTDFLQVISDITSGLDVHIGADHSVDLVVYKYVLHMASGINYC